MNRKTTLFACIALMLLAGTVDAGLFNFLRPRRARQVAVVQTPAADASQSPAADVPQTADNSQQEGGVMTDVPELARREILRRGSLVERVGPGWSNSYVSEVMGPPADDSHKWFISVIVRRDCPACERLLADLAASPYLKAYVDVEDHTQSWAHFNVFQAEDQTQAWRFKDIRIGGYPTILVQPPRNGRYGDPHTVVLQKTGYDGNPEKLAAAIRSAILQYVQKVRPRQFPRQGMRQTGGDDASTPPAARYEPPFVPPPSPPEIPSQPVAPHQPVDIPPVPTPQTPSGIGLVSLLLSALGALLGSSALTNILLIALAVMIGVREFRKATGQKLLLDDEAFSRIVAEIKTLIDGDQKKKDGSDGG